VKTTVDKTAEGEPKADVKLKVGTLTADATGVTATPTGIADPLPLGSYDGDVTVSSIDADATGATVEEPTWPADFADGKFSLGDLIVSYLLKYSKEEGSETTPEIPAIPTPET